MASIKLKRFLPVGWEDMSDDEIVRKTADGVVGSTPADLKEDIVSGYVFRERVYFNTSGSYTFTKASYPWLKAIGVHVLSAGGGGGGAPSTGPGQVRWGEGGSAGTYGYKFLDEDALDLMPASASVVVGAGGTGGTAGGANSTAGGDTYFQHTASSDPVTTMIRVQGGFRGWNNSTTSFPVIEEVYYGNDNASNVDFVLNAGPRNPAILYNKDVSVSGTGENGPGPFGGAGGTGRTVSGVNFGIGATPWGAGGGGAIRGESEGTGEAGGDGSDGIVVLDLYE